MKWRARCLLISIGISALSLASIQIITSPDSYTAFGGRRLSIKGSAQSPIKRDCREMFPDTHSVRVFSDGREVRHLAFLKVHKTASGTAASIFFRFGLTRGLTFVLPKFWNSISEDRPINDNSIYPRLNKSFDIMTSHVIYDRQAMEKYLYPDTVYVGTVREPYMQFKSSMNYMAPQYVFNLSKTNPIQEYLKDPMKHEPANPRHSFINNRQSVEFGFPDKLIMTKNKTEITNYIKKLDKEFKLVIITEYFDESIILLRRMFGWQLKDVLYRSLHIRGWDRKLTIPRPNDRRMYRKHASVDYALYDFFFRRLWEQIKEAGEGFYDEVLYFKKVRMEVDDFCKVNPNTSYVIPFNRWNPPITVDKELCQMIYSEEEDWLRLIAKKQYSISNLIW